MKKLSLWFLILLITTGIAIFAVACGEGGGGDDDADDDDDTDDDVDDDADDDIDDDVDDDTDDDIDDDVDDDIDDDVDDDTDDDAGEGNAVQIDDPSAEGYVKMYSDLGTQNESFEMEWDWKWVSGDGMSVQLYKQGGDPDWVTAVDFYSAKGPHIEAYEKGGSWVVCVASVNYDQWYHFKMTVDTSGKKYSVFVNGGPTSCTDLDLNIVLLGKIIGVRTLAYSDVAGGQTILDNIVLTRSGTPFFSEDFEDDAVGNPPGAPWTVETDSGGSAVVIQLD